MHLPQTNVSRNMNAAYGLMGGGVVGTLLGMIFNVYFAPLLFLYNAVIAPLIKLGYLCYSYPSFFSTYLTNMAYTFINYGILLTYYWVYFNPDPHGTQDKKKGYIPKSQRTPIYHIRRTLTTSVDNVIKYLDKAIGSAPSPQHRRIRYATERLRKPRWKLNRMTALSAFAAVAFQANNPGIHETMIRFDTDSKFCGVDNRASACMSDDTRDFEGPLIDTKRTIKAFGGTRVHNVKTGTIKWYIEDDAGMVHKHLVPNSYYVPDGRVKLLSPQHWAKAIKSATGNKAWETTNHKCCVLNWPGSDGNMHVKTIPLSESNNVATFTLAPNFKRFQAFCAEAGLDPTTEDSNITTLTACPTLIPDEDTGMSKTDRVEEQPQNPWTSKSYPEPTDFNFDQAPQSETKGRKYGIPVVEDDDTPPIVQADEEERQDLTDSALLLRLHQQFGHISFSKLQEMARKGIIPKRLAKCHPPTCSACLYAKATKRPWRNKKRDDYVPQALTRPGEMVSVDMLTSPSPGFVAHMTGRLTRDRYRYATVYVDQFSRLSYVYLQKTATADETLKGKLAFELYAQQAGVQIKGYFADNGIFNANKWRAACQESKQQLLIAGVNAHHTNGLAEKRIRDLQDLARTMLIHANARWPKAITVNLWPYALRMANEAINNTPSFQNAARFTPVQIFTETKVNPNPKHFVPFGCPTYVLKNELAQNKPHHKWNHRSRVGIYLGTSPQHGRNVALVLNRETGLVSPQFHVKYDRQFQTVRQDRFDSLWQQKSGLLSEKPSIFKRSNKNNNNNKNTTAIKNKSTSSNDTRKRTTRTRENLESAVEPTTKQARTQTGNLGAQDNVQALQPPNASGKRLTWQDQQQDANNSQNVEPLDQRAEPPEMESGQRKNNARPVNNNVDTTSSPHLIEACQAETTTDASQSKREQPSMPVELFCLEALYPNTQLVDPNPLMAYKATADPDTMYHHQAMREPDRQEFINAMQKEVDDQMGNGNFTIMKKTDVPKGKPVLPAVWQMRRKRDIKTRKVKKYKARLNIDGSRQRKGLDYDQTYAPVASWQSIRLLLTLAAVHKWHTKQLDYVLAFPQAPVERDIYMKIPAGIKLDGMQNSSDYVLQLHRNVYGQKQAGRVFNRYLTRKLIKEVGFTQSEHDECVFYKGKTMYVLYTDDSILAGPDESEINQIIEDMKRAKLNITIEGDLQDFLGVNIDRKPDGTIHLTQPHLIDQILDDLRINKDEVNTKSTPAKSSQILFSHLESPPFDNSFHYRSVIGKLNYLERGTRSDIAYITHQCARFTTNPRKEHGDALRWLGRYLKGTRDKGTILNPVKGEELAVYVDADFAGNYDRNDTSNPDTARSRHGYIILYEGCPISWKSQLQTEITLSSTESEYTGLSYALREAIPLMNLLNEMKKQGFKVSTKKPKILCKVFEDNSGALEIATTHKFRPRTKHLNVKLHHFRDYVTRGEIVVLPVRTESQCADYLTKPVNEDILTKLRKMIMGW